MQNGDSKKEKECSPTWISIESLVWMYSATVHVRPNETTVSYKQIFMTLLQIENTVYIILNHIVFLGH